MPGEILQRELWLTNKLQEELSEEGGKKGPFARKVELLKHLDDVRDVFESRSVGHESHGT
jgi:hypothetical protein